MKGWLIYLIIGLGVLLILAWIFLRERTKELRDKFGDKLKDRFGNPLGFITENYTYEMAITAIIIVLAGYVALLAFIDHEWFTSAGKVFFKNFLRAGLYSALFVAALAIWLGWRLTQNQFFKKKGELFDHENNTKYYRTVETYRDEQGRLKIRARTAREGLNQENPFVDLGKNPERGLWKGDDDGEEVEPVILKEMTLYSITDEKGREHYKLTPYLKGGMAISEAFLKARNEEEKDKVDQLAKKLEDETIKLRNTQRRLLNALAAKEKAGSEELVRFISETRDGQGKLRPSKELFAKASKNKQKEEEKGDG